MIISIKRNAVFVASLFAASIILTGCISKPFLVKPADGYVGNISVKSIEVTKSDAVDSDTISVMIRSKLEADATELHGSKGVDMKVKLTHLTAPLPGGDVTAKLLGSKTVLKGVISIEDNGRVVAKYDITADYSEGGLLGKTSTVSFVDPITEVVKKFSAFTVSYMQ